MPAILSGGLIPATTHGTTIESLFHVCDWLPTLLHAVTGRSPPPLRDDASAEIPYDGLDQWEVLLSARSAAAVAPPPRTEIILDHCLEGFSKQPTGCNEYGDECIGGCGALIVDSNLKLIKGPNFVRLPEHRAQCLCSNAPLCECSSSWRMHKCLYSNACSCR